MKELKTNLRLLEKIIRTMSKGYYSDFSEYHPDHTKQDEQNDLSEEIETNDHTIVIDEPKIKHKK